MIVIKKDGSRVLFDDNKIKNAIEKSADRIGVKLTESQKSEVSGYVKYKALMFDEISVSQLHKLVCKSLDVVDSRVSESYRSYRDYKNSYCNSFDKLFQQSKSVLYSIDRENANFDSTLTSTKGSLMRGYLTGELYEKFFMSSEEKQASKVGYIYLHDKKDLIFNSFNCCLFDIANVLNGGFTMANVKYNEPSSVLTALQVIGDIVLVTTAQQFGGQQ